MRRLSLLAPGFLLFAIAVAPAVHPVRVQAAEHGAETKAAHPAGEHAEGGQPNILELKPGLATATVIVFLILFLVLWRFAWGPLSKALHDREHNMEHTLQAAEQARAEAERLLAEHRGQMAQAAAQIRQMLEDARHGAQVTADEIVKKAHDESEASRQRAERDIATARDQALLDIWTKTADLAVSVAGKVLTKSLGPDEHRRLIETARAELPASPNGHGGHSA